jgi:16S rRNA (uracil1498-N3)-methyltransferase
MIGPEGDFSSTEIASALQKNIIPVSLGQQRYRTETAGLLGCHTLFIKQQQYTNA